MSDLRRNLLSKRSYSIFVGDKSYKTNFWLRFIDQGLGKFSHNDVDVNKKFRNTMMRLNRYSLCWLLFFVSVGIWLTKIVNQDLSLLSLLSILITTLWCLWISKSYSLPNTQKVIFSLVVMQILIFVEGQQEFKIFVLLMINFTVDILNGYQWYFHSGVNCLLFSYQIQKYFLYLLVDMVIYSLIELSFKKNWVVQDTAKRSEKLFLNCFDKFPFEVFIVDK